MRVIIVGGGNVGTYIAAELSQADHEVLIVENDPDRVAWAERGRRPAGRDLARGRRLRGHPVRHGQARDGRRGRGRHRRRRGQPRHLAARQAGVRRAPRRRPHQQPDNEWLFNETWGVDVAVSTPHLLTALVEEAVSVGSLVRLLSFEGDRARLSEVKLADNSPANGKDLQHVEFPRGSTVVAILRGEHLVVPRGDTVFHEGDEVMVLVTDDSEEKVRELLIG